MAIFISQGYEQTAYQSNFAAENVNSFVLNWVGPSSSTTTYEFTVSATELPPPYFLFVQQGAHGGMNLTFNVQFLHYLSDPSPPFFLVSSPAITSTAGAIDIFQFFYFPGYLAPIPGVSVLVGQVVEQNTNLVTSLPQ